MSDHEGQIGLVFGPPQTWFQKVTCWVTDSPVYHCVIGTGGRMCVGAESPVAIERPIEHFPHIIWLDMDLEPWQRDGISNWARNHVGTAYNFVDDAAIGLERIFHEHTPKMIIRRLASSKHMECAQLCDAAYWYGARMQLFEDHRYFSAVAPCDFVPFAQDLGSWPATLPIGYRSARDRRALRAFEMAEDLAGGR